MSTHISSIGENIRTIRTRRGITQKELASMIGKSYSSIQKYEMDLATPPLQVIEKLAEALGVDKFEIIGWNNYVFNEHDKKDSISDNILSIEKFSDLNSAAEQESNKFSTSEICVIKKYRALDEHGKELVSLVLDKEYERVSALEESEDVEEVPFRISEQPAAAGLGVYLGPESFRTVMVRADAIPRKAAFGVPVSGDSMEPKYHDGDILIVSTDKPERGEVGIFTMDGHGYVKVFGNDELISLNPAYDPIPMTEDIICNGKVIGVMDKDDVK